MGTKIKLVSETVFLINPLSYIFLRLIATLQIVQGYFVR
jgi:hypothetical protein